MVYATAGLKCVAPGMGSGPALWVYSSTDPNTDVDAVGYFTDAKDRGMKVGDIVFVVDTDTGVGNTTVHSVNAIDADTGAGSINTALLA